MAIEQKMLSNGLRVVIAPDSVAPVVTVGVYYKIGFRLEPQGRSGFAHLFEHMMFQGSANAPKMEHIKLINSSGGVLNGSTMYDVTNYYEAVPSNALRRVLWLEADRMRTLKVDDENLSNQRDVVKEEVRVNVLNQPYGGFPWLDMPPVAFRNWANAHNYYGDFADLDAATLADVQAFFKTYYLPNNAVLLILGDVKPEEGFSLAEKYFADIPAGPKPPFADPAEPGQTEERRGHVEEKFGTLPAIAIGYVLPPRRSPEWCAMGLLDQMLIQGDDSLLYQELVKKRGFAGEISGGINADLGDMFDYSGPMLWTTSLIHDASAKPEQILSATDSVIQELVSKPVDQKLIDRSVTKMRSYLYDSMTQFGGFGRANLMACFALFDDDPAKINSLDGNFRKVTPAVIQRTARAYLKPANRTVLVIEPGAAEPGAAKPAPAASEGQK